MRLEGMTEKQRGLVGLGNKRMKSVRVEVQLRRPTM